MKQITASVETYRSFRSLVKNHSSRSDALILYTRLYTIKKVIHTPF